MEPVVEFAAAVALLGRFPALSGVDLTVAPSEVVHLEGPNGAGKTTLLRVCAGLARVHSGTATVVGVDLLTNRSAVRSSVGLLAHESQLYDALSVEQNLEFFARAAGVDRSSVAAEIAAATDAVGLEKRLLEVPVSVLSAGQRKRASMASLVLRRPLLWLLDEPHAGLDELGRDMVDSLISAAAASGATVLLASHEKHRARGICTRTVAMSGGAVSDAGPSASAQSSAEER